MRSLGGERWRGGSDGRPEWQPSEAGHWQGLSDRWANLSVCPGATLPQALLPNPSSLASDLSLPWSDHPGFYVTFCSCLRPLQTWDMDDMVTLPYRTYMGWLTSASFWASVG